MMDKIKCPNCAHEFDVEEALSGKLEAHFKALAAEQSLKPGDLMLPFRIMLVGGKFGPGVFEIIQSIELKDAKERIEYSLKLLSNK